MCRPCSPIYVALQATVFTLIAPSMQQAIVFAAEGIYCAILEQHYISIFNITSALPLQALKNSAQIIGSVERHHTNRDVVSHWCTRHCLHNGRVEGPCGPGIGLLSYIQVVSR